MRVQRSLMCRIMHPFLCACLHRGLFADPVKWVGNLAREYIRVEKELVRTDLDDQNIYVINRTHMANIFLWQECDLEREAYATRTT